MKLREILAEVFMATTAAFAAQADDWKLAITDVEGKRLG